MGIFLISLGKKAKCWIVLLKRVKTNFFLQNNFLFDLRKYLASRQKLYEIVPYKIYYKEIFTNSLDFHKILEIIRLATTNNNFSIKHKEKSKGFVTDWHKLWSYFLYICICLFLVLIQPFFLSLKVIRQMIYIGTQNFINTQ